MRALPAWMVAVAAISRLSCTDDAPVEPGDPTIVRGLWKNTAPMDTIEYIAGSTHHLGYIELGADFRGRVYLQTRDRFRWSTPSSYSVDGATIHLQDLVLMEPEYDYLKDVLSVGDQQFERSVDTAIVGAWADSVALTDLVVLPGDGRRGLTYQGLAFDGTSLYTLESFAIRNYSTSGALIRVVPIPAGDSLSGGFRQYTTCIAYANGYIWLAVVHNLEAQRVYKLHPDSLTPVGSIVLSGTSRLLRSMAVSDGGDTIRAIAQGFNGDAVCWLHTIDAATGAEIVESRRLATDPEPLAFRDGYLWGERIVTTSSSIAERHYLQEFDPTDRMTRRSVRLTGFPDLQFYPFGPRISGVAFVDGGVYVLDGYDHTLWRDAPASPVAGNPPPSPEPDTSSRR